MKNLVENEECRLRRRRNPRNRSKIMESEIWNRREASRRSLPQQRVSDGDPSEDPKIESSARRNEGTRRKMGLRTVEKVYARTQESTACPRQWKVNTCPIRAPDKDLI